MSELDNLEKQIAELQAKKDAIITAKRNAVLEETRGNVRQYGFTAQELGLGGHPKKTVKVKRPITFRDEATGKEWDGELTQKGRKPEWIQQSIDAGTIEQFRVKNS